MQEPAPIGNETSERADETNDVSNVRTGNDFCNAQTGNTLANRRRRAKKRFEQTPESIIARVQRETSKNATLGKTNEAADIKLDPEIEGWIRLKLFEWDADRSGAFNHEEVAAAMDELRDVQQRHRALKWNIMFCFGTLLVFVGVMVGAVFIVMLVTKDVQVGNDAGMTAKVPNTKPAQKSIIETTQSRNEGGLGDLLDYDEATDQWLLSEDHLRSIDQVSFKNVNGSFFNLDLAELIRIDSGAAGTIDNDQVNMLTTGGHQVRIWASIGELEIKWEGTGMWETVAAPGSSGGRLLDEEEDGLEPNETSVGRRLGKGSGRSYVFVGYHHGPGRGAGGGGCQGWCNVPTGTPCGSVCGPEACYNVEESGRSTTYRCTGGAPQRLTRLAQLFLHGLTWLMILHVCSN